jgi:hypothetical protein
MSGPYVYDKVDELEGAKKVGNKQCAGLVQYYLNVGTTDHWTNGKHVRGNGLSIKKGTAVATFRSDSVEGKGYYAGEDHGNHAAFYMSQDASGVTVMDQWADDKRKPTISSRVMGFLGQNKDGTYVNPSNNGDALAVIMKSATVMKPKKAGV